jgi:hypothetical protein
MERGLLKCGSPRLRIQPLDRDHFKLAQIGHCERSEAIQQNVGRRLLDCFVALLLEMTARFNLIASCSNRSMTLANHS